VYTTQRDAQTRAINREHNPTQRCAVTQQPQRSAAQRRTRHNTKPQSQYCGTAPYSLRSRQRRQCTPRTRVVHRANHAATTPHIFTGPMHTSRTCRPAPRFPTRARRHTRCDEPHPAQRHVSVMARVTQYSARLQAMQRHIAHSHTAYKHTSPTRPHDVSHSTNHCAPHQHHRIHTAARTPHTARHTAPTTPHAARRKSHPVTHAACAPHSR
jgi:hypothetical protein